jgi:hypothetical protein
VKSVRGTITLVCAVVSCGKSQQGIGTVPTVRLRGWVTLCVDEDLRPEWCSVMT